MTPTIREYQPEHDTPRLRECVVELQEFERTIEPALPPGIAMADAYLAYILERCREYHGKVFVAEVDGQVVGFVFEMEKADKKRQKDYERGETRNWEKKPTEQ